MLRPTIFFLMVLTCSFIFNLQADPLSAKKKIVVISHPQVDETTISKNTLRAMFSMHLQVWPNGSSVTVFVLDDRNDLHQQFSKTILGLFSYQLRRSWDRQVYSGTGEAPIVVDNIQQMKQKVANTPGSIGYMPENSLDKKVKRLEVK